MTLFRTNFLSRLCALFLSFYLALPTIAQPEAFAIDTQNAVEVGELLLKIPESLASVNTYYKPGPENNSSLVIHILDAHANPEAQLKIRDILKWLEDVVAPQIVGAEKIVLGLEGAHDTLHPEYLELMPEEPQFNNEAVSRMAERGELTGAELYAWETRKNKRTRPFKFFGLEDADLYQKNLAAYRSSIAERSVIAKELLFLSHKVRTAAANSLPPELNEIFTEIRRRKEGNYGSRDTVPQLIPYVQYLTRKAAANLKIDLNDPAEQIRFPQIMRVLSLIQLEGDFNQNKVEAERSEIESLEPIKKSLQPSLVGVLHPTRSTNARSNYENLIQQFRAKSLDISIYPSFTRAAILNILNSELNVRSLYSEMERIEEELVLNLAKSDVEKRIARVVLDFQILEKILHLELTREEYETVKARLNALHPRAIAREIRDHVKFSKKDERILRRLEQRLNSAITFYRDAERRDHTLFNNLRSVSTEQKASVIISGGFHADGIRDLAMDEGLGYIAISPNFQRIMPSQASDELFLGSRTALLESKAQITRQQALLLDELVRHGSEYLKNRGMLKNEASAKIQSLTEQHSILSQRVRLRSVESAASGQTIQVPTEHRHSRNQLDLSQAAVSSELIMQGHYDEIAQPSALYTRARPDSFTGYQAYGLVFDTQKSAMPEFTIDRSDARNGNGRVGIVGIEGQLPTATILGRAGLKIDAIPTDAEAWELIRNSQAIDPLNVSILALKGQLNVYDRRDESSFAKMLATNDIIYLDTSFPVGGDSEVYQERLLSLAMQLGDAIRVIRDRPEIPRKRKVFVIRGEVGIEMTEKIKGKLLWHAKPNHGEDLNFDVVYQPDLSSRGEDGEVSEPYVIFGLTSDNAETQSMLRQLYESKPALKTVEIDFIPARSAEQNKDASTAYKAGKLVHFNGFAFLADRFKADLNVINAGAAEDGRIRKGYMQPSHGFGGRLLSQLRSIKYERLHRAAFKHQRRVEDIQDMLDWAKRALAKGEDGDVVMSTLPRELHFLFWIEELLRVNEQTQEYFYEKIVNNQIDFRGKSAAIIGFGYNQRNGQLTESPAIRLIHKLYSINGVTDFWISDPNSEAAIRAWEATLKKNLNFGDLKLHYVSDVYEAARKADFSIIATDSNPQIFDLDLPHLAKELNGKILFDGINLFGLRADGQTFYSFEELREAHLREKTSPVNMVSVGRPSIGPRFEQPGQIDIADSVLYKTLEEFPVKDFVQHNVAMIGAMYVALVTGANLTTQGIDGSTEGHNVTIVELPRFQSKIDALEGPETKLPIYEPGLRDRIIEAKREGSGKKRTMFFTTDLIAAVEKNPIIYLAVGTPEDENGDVDLSQILGATIGTRESPGIADAMLKMKEAGRPHFRIIAIKSTVPPNTFDEIVEKMRLKGFMLGVDYALVSNPEFLREGDAMRDVTEPDRTVLGVHERYPEKPSGMTAENYAQLLNTIKANFLTVRRMMMELWFPLMKNHPHPILVTGATTASLIKYAANSFLLTSISFANILATDSHRNDVDYFQVRKGLVKDPAIGDCAFLSPGSGSGGSCFPKDVRGIDRASTKYTGHRLSAVNSADKYNDYHKNTIVRRLLGFLSQFPMQDSPLYGNTIAAWGISFKPRTDDVRETPTATVLTEMIQKGVSQIRFHDPSFDIPPPEGPGKTHIIDRFIAEVHKLFVKRHMYTDSPRSNGETRSQWLWRTENEFIIWFKDTYVKTRHVVFVDKPMQAVKGENGDKDADALLILTDWEDYKQIPIETIPPSDARFVIGDGRNIWRMHREEVYKRPHLQYYGVGVADIRRSEDRPIFGGIAIPRGLNTPDFRQYLLERDLPIAPALPADFDFSVNDVAKQTGGLYSIEGIREKFGQTVSLDQEAANQYAASYLRERVITSMKTELNINNQERKALNSSMSFIKSFLTPLQHADGKHKYLLVENFQSMPQIDQTMKLWLLFLSQHPELIWSIDLDNVSATSLLISSLKTAAQEWGYKIQPNQIVISASSKIGFDDENLTQSGVDLVKGYLAENEGLLKNVQLHRGVQFRKTVHSEIDQRTADRLLAAKALFEQYGDKGGNRYDGAASDFATDPGEYSRILASIQAFAAVQGSA